MNASLRCAYYHLSLEMLVPYKYQSDYNSFDLKKVKRDTIIYILRILKSLKGNCEYPGESKV